MARYRLKYWYSGFEELIIEARDLEEAHEIEEVGEDEDLTELTEDDKRWIDQYYEHLKKQQAQQETSLEADQG